MTYPKRRRRQPIEPRFWSKVNRAADDGCWEWQAYRDRLGYGGFRIGGRVGGRSHLAHRVAYELLVGPIPDGLQLDHLCRNPPCVNPAHLEPVTQRENLLRGNTIVARAKQTECLRGHAYTPDNTYVSYRGTRSCRTCTRERNRRTRRVT